MTTRPPRPVSPRGFLPTFLSTPAFADAELTERALTFHRVARSTALLVTAIVPIVTVAQPETLLHAIRVVVVVDAMAIVTLALNHQGRTRLASRIYLGVLIALLTVNALEVGGIRSPGVQAFFLFVMLAGLLLGQRAGSMVALVCAVLGLGLVLAEAFGVGPPRQHPYNAVALWLLTCVYIGVALLILREATSRVERALARAQAELAERKEAEDRLARALVAGRIGIIDHDLATGVIRGDERALELTGLAARPDGTVPFAEWFDLVHPEDRERVMADLELFSTGLPGGRTQYRLVRPDGVQRNMEAAAHLSLDARGRPAAILGMILDVTEREQAEAERERLVKDLGERVKELRLLHEAARLLQQARAIDRPLLADLVERLPPAWLHAADACARITYRDLEVKTEDWRETPWCQSVAFSTSDGDGAIEVAYRSAHPDRDEGPFLAEERALIESLAELLRTHLEQHVAERQRQGLEAQLRQAQKMDALGTLAGGIAHDFNNILTAIGGNAQLAAEEAPAGGRLAGTLQEILQAYERARDLVRRILLFSRQQESSRQVMALPPVVDEALKLLRSSLPKNIEIRTAVAPGLPSVCADATQMHQVVMNLGTNAGYAMRERGGTLSVELDSVMVGAVASAPSANLAPGRHVRLTVRDTGAGMSREVRERLFEPFFTTKGQAGTGLGLSVVHGIIRDHGGAITVDSEPGAGTRFRIYLPAREEAAPQSTAAASIPRGTGEHIMYVDDEAALTLVMSRMFHHLGYRCTGFTDPAAALHEFQTAPHAFDAVITDLQMPTMSGLDLVRSVRAIRADIPVAVASGNPAEKGHDADGPSLPWIPKPSTLAELGAILQRIMDPEARGA